MSSGANTRAMPQENLITQILREKREGEAHTKGVPNPQRTWKITHYSFGKITVDGEQYTHDVIVGWDKAQPVKKWTRKEWHKAFKRDLEADVKRQKPAVVIIGCGASNMLRVQPETEEWLKLQGIELIAKDTHSAVKEFNNLIEKSEMVTGFFHVTC